jgi:hypothetical protein
MEQKNAAETAEKLRNLMLVNCCNTSFTASRCDTTRTGIRLVIPHHHPLHKILIIGEFSQLRGAFVDAFHQREKLRRFDVRPATFRCATQLNIRQLFASWLCRAKTFGTVSPIGATLPKRSGQLSQSAQPCRSVRDDVTNQRNLAEAFGAMLPISATLPKRSGQLRQSAQPCRSVRDGVANRRRSAEIFGTNL